MYTFESKSSDRGRAGRNLARGLPRRRQLGRRAPPPLLRGARPHERDALTAAGRVLAGGALTCKPSAVTRAACVQIGGCACARAEARSQQRRTWVPGTAASSPRARGGRCGTLREARPEAHRRRRGPPAPPRRRRGRAAPVHRRGRTVIRHCHLRGGWRGEELIMPMHAGCGVDVLYRGLWSIHCFRLPFWFV